MITGDSLAYNRYDFIDETRMNAYDCNRDMKSWSFLLRDFFISERKGWRPAAELEISGKGLIKRPLKDTPFGSEGLDMDIPKNTDIVFGNCGNKTLYFVTGPEKSDGLTLDGHEVDLGGNTNKFEGCYFLPIKSKSGILRNGDSCSRIRIAGVADTKVNVHLTGSGSKTAQWLMKNSYERIFQYEPDLCIMIIGANNRHEKNPEGFYNALGSLFKKLTEENCKIIYLSPPHSSTTDPSAGADNIYMPDENITRPLLEGAFKLAKEFNASYMDLFDFFSGTPDSVWRYDNTHFTKEGNRMLFREIINRFFREGST